MPSKRISVGTLVVVATAVCFVASLAPGQRVLRAIPENIGSRLGLPRSNSWQAGWRSKRCAAIESSGHICGSDRAHDRADQPRRFVCARGTVQHAERAASRVQRLAQPFERKRSVAVPRKSQNKLRRTEMKASFAVLFAIVV